jgi:hypothetical protein
MDRRYLIFIGMGFELVGLTVASLYVGSIADAKYSLNGLGVAGGAVAGLLCWLIHLVAVIRKIETDTPEDGT